MEQGELFDSAFGFGEPTLLLQSARWRCVGHFRHRPDCAARRLRHVPLPRRTERAKPCVRYRTEIVQFTYAVEPDDRVPWPRRRWFKRTERSHRPGSQG